MHSSTLFAGKSVPEFRGNTRSVEQRDVDDGKKSLPSSRIGLNQMIRYGNAQP